MTSGSYHIHIPILLQHHQHKSIKLIFYVLFCLYFFKAGIEWPRKPFKLLEAPTFTKGVSPALEVVSKLMLLGFLMFQKVRIELTSVFFYWFEVSCPIFLVTSCQIEPFHLHSFPSQNDCSQTQTAEPLSPFKYMLILPSCSMESECVWQDHLRHWGHGIELFPSVKVKIIPVFGGCESVQVNHEIRHLILYMLKKQTQIHKQQWQIFSSSQVWRCAVAIRSRRGICQGYFRIQVSCWLFFLSEWWRWWKLNIVVEWTM